MEIPTYGSKHRRHLKFAEATAPYAVRLPKSMVQQIKTEGWDIGQLIFNILSGEASPDSEGSDWLLRSVTKKLISLMIEHEIQSPEGFFTAMEEALVRKLVEE